MTQDQRNWFGQLPEHLQLSVEDKSIRVVHGAASDINRFMFASQPDSDFLDEFALLDANQKADSHTHTETDVVIAGHSGLPFTKHIANKQWHNSGALGMPANDGTQDVWFSVLESIDNELTFSHHRLDYDVESAYQQMLKNNLTQGYHQALKTGLWPSMDVLPEFEKQQQGITFKLLRNI
jgi:predicted phosphodiesterase